jgi:hypothetical protein
MNYLAMFLDTLLVPEAGIVLAFLIVLVFLWINLRKIKTLKRTISILEEGHREWEYQSSEMRRWRYLLITSDRTDMSVLQNRSREILDFFDRIGFLMHEKILSSRALWPYFGRPIQGYFTFLYPHIQWLRTQGKEPDFYDYFEELNEAIYRLNRKAYRKKARLLMEEEELKRFIEEEKRTLYED